MPTKPTNILLATTLLMKHAQSIRLLAGPKVWDVHPLLNAKIANLKAIAGLKQMQKYMV
jgi:hypothetical protein